MDLSSTTIDSDGFLDLAPEKARWERGVPAYPVWTDCPEDHPRSFAPKCTIYKGFIIHMWGRRNLCTTPFMDSAGAVAALPVDKYTQSHTVEGLETRCNMFSSVEEVIAFIDNEWLPMERLRGKNQ